MQPEKISGGFRIWAKKYNFNIIFYIFFSKFQDKSTPFPCVLALFLLYAVKNPFSYGHRGNIVKDI